MTTIVLTEITWTDIDNGEHITFLNYLMTFSEYCYVRNMLDKICYGKMLEFSIDKMMTIAENITPLQIKKFVDVKNSWDIHAELVDIVIFQEPIQEHDYNMKAQFPVLDTIVRDIEDDCYNPRSTLGKLQFEARLVEDGIVFE